MIRAMIKNRKIFLVTLPASLILVGLSYFGFLFIAHQGNPHFLKIDRCLDSGGKWNYQENNCEYIDGMPKEWHVSPSKNPRSSMAYPLVSWHTVQQIKIGMNEHELKSLIRDIQSYHHPINAIVFTEDPRGIEYEVAIKLSANKKVEGLSFKIRTFQSRHRD